MEVSQEHPDNPTSVSQPTLAESLTAVDEETAQHDRRKVGELNQVDPAQIALKVAKMMLVVADARFPQAALLAEVAEETWRLIFEGLGEPLASGPDIARQDESDHLLCGESCVTGDLGSCALGLANATIVHPRTDEPIDMRG